VEKMTDEEIEDVKWRRGEEQVRARLVFDYDTDDRDRVEEIRLMQDAWKWRATVEDLRTWLRGLAKYEGVESIEVEKVRDKLSELLEERELNLY
jgi:2,3-bisphosphoglycerate-independent phosphoglycerate mutase